MYNTPTHTYTLPHVHTPPPPHTHSHIQDPELLHFIDIECYCWSTVLADLTPMINAGMVFCDRHFGGINYPKVCWVCWVCWVGVEWVWVGVGLHEDVCVGRGGFVAP